MENRVWHKWPDEKPKNREQCYVTVRHSDRWHVVVCTYFEDEFLAGVHWAIGGACPIFDDSVVGWMKREAKPEPMCIERPKVIAVDFDGCICVNAYPDIGKPNIEVINALISEVSCGTQLVLWTCREGEKLEEAIAACESWGIKFAAINESTPEWIAVYGTSPRKVGADEYWDDKAVRADRDGVH